MGGVYTREARMSFRASATGWEGMALRPRPFPPTGSYCQTTAGQTLYFSEKHEREKKR